MEDMIAEEEVVLTFERLYKTTALAHIEHKEGEERCARGHQQ